MIRGLAVVALLAGVAHAGPVASAEPASPKPAPAAPKPAPASPKPAPAAPKPAPVAPKLAVAPAKPAPAPEPDSLAQEEAEEANLRSISPRAGLTASIAVFGDLLIGKEVGRGPGLSLRLGHVATSHTVITFELSGGSMLHTPDGGKTTLHNDDLNLLAGAQYYVSPSLWLRFSGGLGVYVIDSGPMGREGHPGPAAAVGVGVDLARWRSLVLGIEALGVTSINSAGFLVDSSLGLGLSYY